MLVVFFWRGGELDGMKKYGSNTRQMKATEAVKNTVIHTT